MYPLPFVSRNSIQIDITDDVDNITTGKSITSINTSRTGNNSNDSSLVVVEGESPNQIQINATNGTAGLNVNDNNMKNNNNNQYPIQEWQFVSSQLEGNNLAGTGTGAGADTSSIASKPLGSSSSTLTSNPSTTEIEAVTASPSPQKAAELFPYLLHGMLEDAERVGQITIVSWTADGKSFRIHDLERFESGFLGQYFGTIGNGNGKGDRLTQFRSHLKGWGFDNPNPMDSEIFFHPCFQKGDPSLCHYMRCGKTKVEHINNNINNIINKNRKEELMTSTHKVVNEKNVQTQVRDNTLLMNRTPASTVTVTVTAPTTMETAAAAAATNSNTKAKAFGNTAATQMLLEQEIHKVKQHQHQLQQSAAHQLQALLSNSNITSNPSIAALLLNQILAVQQQQNQCQQQQHFSPEALVAVAQGLQRPRQIITAAPQIKSSAVGNVNSVNVSLISTQNSPSAAIVAGSGGVVQQSPVINAAALSADGMNSLILPSAMSTKKPMVLKQSIRQIIHNNDTPQVKRMPVTKKYAAGRFNKATTLPKKATIAAVNTPTAYPAVSAKRAAFLNKRSKATGAAYRNPNKKQKRIPSGVSSKGRGRKKAVTTKSAAMVTNKNGGTSFTLNEDFKEAALVSIDLLFPWKLHDMLDDTDHDEDLKRNVVSWQPDGVSFAIHDQDRFIKEVVPRYFEKTTWELEDFLRVLSSWGIVQITTGATGAFIHRLLVKGKRSICKQMRVNGKTVSDWMKRHDQFLCRLHALICHAEKEGTRSIVSFTPDGKKFRIHDPDAFMNSVFPLYFDSLTYSSFEQKLRRWGFVRSPANHQQKIDKTTKLENATYGHPCFLRAKIPTLTWIKSDTSIPRTLRPLNNFVYRLRVMLSDSSRHGHQFIVSWCGHGKAFMIHDRPYFSNDIMPHYFKSKFTSFRQSLRNHGFAQIGGNGWDEGAYYHKLFLRDEPLLCQGLTQDQFKKSMPEWLPVEDEPTFYPKDNHESVVAAAAMLSLKSSPSNSHAMQII